MASWLQSHSHVWVSDTSVHASRLEDSDSTDTQPSRLHPSHLKLTTIDSFWLSVETSAATGKALPATANYDNSYDPDEPLLPSLEKTIIILPRIVTMIRPVGKGWKRTAENHVWNDTAAWDRDALIEMLERFLSITGAKTIPSLAEYTILPDKVGRIIRYDWFTALQTYA